MGLYVREGDSDVRQRMCYAVAWHVETSCMHRCSHSVRTSLQSSQGMLML